MPIQTLVFEEENDILAEIIESGLSKEKWTLSADARIKTESDPVGIGPVAYVGIPKDDMGVYNKDGAARDMMALFYTGTTVLMATLYGQLPGDITATIANYLLTHGGDPAAMSAKAPSIG